MMKDLFINFHLYTIKAIYFPFIKFKNLKIKVAQQSWLKKTEKGKVVFYAITTLSSAIFFGEKSAF